MENASPSPASDAQGDPVERSQRASLKRKRTTHVACENCRDKKIACDGGRPVCKQCAHRRVACRYSHDVRDGETWQAAQKRELDAARERLDGIANALSFLSTLPESEALELMRRLALDPHPLFALSTLQNGVHLADTLSGHAVTRSVLPQTRTAFEFELMMHHSQAYPVVVLIDPSALPMRHTARRSMHTRISAYSRNHRVSESPGSSLGSGISASSSQPTPGQSRGGSSHPGEAEVSPNPESLTVGGSQPSSRYIDPRLERLNIQFWTSVPIANAHAAELISHYLEIEHPLLGFFEAHLFVQDLVGQQLEFCSHLLVSAVLFWACLCKTLSDSRLPSFSRAFLAEAKKLAPTCWSSDNILTVAASQLLSLGCACNGSDRLAQYFKWEGVRLGERLALFSMKQTAIPIQSYEQWRPDVLIATSHVAWGAFNWLCLHGQYYGEEPAKSPPPFPTPSECRQSLDANNSVLHMYSDHLAGATKAFTALCKFRRIQSNVILAYRASNARPVADHISLRFAEENYRELLAWASSLDPAVRRGEQCPHYVLVLHIWYHTALIDLFRPFVGRRQKLQSMASPDSTPEAVIAASLSQLKALAITYYHFQDSACCSILWHTSLLYIGNSILQNPRCLEWRFYFSTCIDAYLDLSESFCIAVGFCQGLLWLAINNGRISVKEARRTLYQLSQRQSHAPEDCKSGHIIDLDLATTNYPAALIETVVDQLSDLAVADEISSG